MLAIINILFLFLLLFVNPLSLIAWITAIIAWFIPWEYLGLWITSVVSIWSIVSFPFNRPYTDDRFDFFGDLIIYSTNLALFVGMVGVIIVRLQKNHHKHRERSAFNKRGKFLSFTAYGMLAAYFGYLFLSDLWHNYRPAWQAYFITFIAAFLIIISCWLLQTYRFKHQITWIKDLFTSIYSFATSIILILVSNLIFPVLAINETKKVIEYHGDRNIKHCIQTNRKPLETWLYLSPLTAWNKPGGSLGAAGLRHAVLVIDKNNEYILYHWSYKLRKWEFTSVGFEPGAFTVPDSLGCTPEENYWSDLPFLFPKVSPFETDRE